MTRFTLTLLEEHHAAIRANLFRDGNERALILICGRSRHTDPWTGTPEERFLSRQIIDVDDRHYRIRTPTQLEWSTTPFYDALKLVEDKDLAVAVFHSHPHGPLAFSSYDDTADQELFQIAAHRGVSGSHHLSVVMDGSGEVIARAYGDELKPATVKMTRVIGDRWVFRYPRRGTGYTASEFDRQVRAFGAATTEDLGHLRIGIAGCGGTGSAVASLIARIGVRRLVLFDDDRVDETNLNRMHFSRREDANLFELKVDVLARGLAGIGLPLSIVRLPYAIDSEACRDAVRACDVIFGCTDDHLGRNFLNRTAHFYLIPIVDLGLLIEPNDHGSYDSFDGRVTVVQPGYPCQICRGLIDARVMLAEGLRRNDPVLYRQRRRAGYIPGATDPAPVVVTFTTELAAVAVNEMFHRLTGFRGPEAAAAERVRKFDEVKDADTLPSGRRRVGCKLCDLRRYDGRGDMLPFLDQA